MWNPKAVNANLSQLRELLSIRKLTRVDFLVVFILFEAMLLIGGSSLPYFGSSWSQFQTPLIAYMIINASLFVVGYGKEDARLKQVDFLPASMGVVSGFLIGWFVTLAVVMGLHIQVMQVHIEQAMMILIWQAVVATNEELAFRGILPGKVGNFGATALFALFHFASYGWNLYAMGFAFILGVIFLYAYIKTKNLGVPIGLHWAYNGVVTGVLMGSFV